jgi:hypothetical protein
MESVLVARLATELEMAALYLREADKIAKQIQEG